MGPLRAPAPVRSRVVPKELGRACGGDRDDDQDDAQLQPVASSTDVTLRDAAKHAWVPLRPVVPTYQSRPQQGR
jgi:hypothetical protein